MLCIKALKCVFVRSIYIYIYNVHLFFHMDCYKQNIHFFNSTFRKNFFVLLYIQLFLILFVEYHIFISVMYVTNLLKILDSF